MFFCEVVYEKISFLSISILAFMLISCAPGARPALPPDATFLLGMAVPQQAASVTTTA
jgi:hypothetical protein